MAIQCRARTASHFGIHSRSQHLGELPQLTGREAHVHADAHVRLQLRIGPGQCREHAHGGQLAALPIEVVPLEDVAEQVGAQVLVRRRREIERLAAANRLKEAELATQALRRQLWAAFSAALILLAIVLVQWLRRSRRANRRLSRDVADLAEQSSHDPLTRVFNRRHGQARLATYQRTVEAAPPEAMPALADFIAGAHDVAWEAAAINALIKSCIGAHGLKMPTLAMPLRVLLTGQAQTPSVDAVIALFPRELVLKRLAAASTN